MDATIEIDVDEPFQAYPNGEMFIITQDVKGDYLEHMPHKHFMLYYKCVICFDLHRVYPKDFVLRCGECKKLYCMECAHKLGYGAKKCGVCRTKWNSYKVRP